MTDDDGIDAMIFAWRHIAVQGNALKLRYIESKRKNIIR